MGKKKNGPWRRNLYVWYNEIFNLFLKGSFFYNHSNKGMGVETMKKKIYETDKFNYVRSVNDFRVGNCIR